MLIEKINYSNMWCRGQYYDALEIMLQIQSAGHCDARDVTDFDRTIGNLNNYCYALIYAIFLVLHTAKNIEALC